MYLVAFLPTILKFYIFDNLSRNMADDWQSPNSRKNVVAKITEYIQSSGLGPSKYACILENYVYETAATKEEYLKRVCEMYSKLGEKIICDPAGKPQQPPNVDLDNANVMQDPLNALQTLSSQGNRNAQMMPMGSGQPNQMPPGSVVGVNVAASNLLQTKRDSRKFELASVMTDDWQSPKFRQNLVAKIIKVIQPFVLDSSKSVCNIENDTTENYLEQLAKALRILTKMINRALVGKQQQPPNAVMDFLKFSLLSILTHGFQSPKFRQCVVAKFTKLIECSGSNPSKDAGIIENNIYEEARTKEEYLREVGDLIMSSKATVNRDPAGKPEQPPNADMGNANVMQDPLNALQTLASQGNGDAQMMPMGSGQPNQMPPGAVVGVNVAASNLLQTKRKLSSADCSENINNGIAKKRRRQETTSEAEDIEGDGESRSRNSGTQHFHSMG